jgi:hypothetical protein
MEQQEYSIIIISIIIIRDGPDSRDLFPPYHFWFEVFENP